MSPTDIAGGETLINIVLLSFLVVAAFGIARLRNLFAAAMLTGLYSLLSACLFTLLDAVDVALTEAAVGAGMTTVLFLAALALTFSEEKATPRRRGLLATVVVTLTGVLLLYATLDMPYFGDPEAPIHTHPIFAHYMADSAREIGIPNVVTSILASYRGYDTLGEVTVIFAAGAATLMLLGLGRRHKDDK